MSTLTLNPSPPNSINGAEPMGSAEFSSSTNIFFDSPTASLGSVFIGAVRRAIWITFEISAPAGTVFQAVSLGLHRDSMVVGLGGGPIGTWVGFLAPDTVWELGGDAGRGWLEYPNMGALPHPASSIDTAWLGAAPSLSHNLSVFDHSDGDLIKWGFGTGAGFLHYQSPNFLTDIQTAFDANETHRTTRGVPIAMALFQDATPSTTLLTVGSESSLNPPNLFLEFGVIRAALEISAHTDVNASLTPLTGTIVTGTIEINAGTIIGANLTGVKQGSIDITSAAALSADLSEKTVPNVAVELTSNTLVVAEGVLLSQLNPNPGYIFRAAPKSVQEAVSRSSHDRIKSITKQAIQYYIEQFMNTDGVKRSVTEAVGSISRLFITDKDTLTTDPTLRPTQIARYYQDIRERMPAILIVDSGMEYVDPGLNILDHVTAWGERDAFGQPKKWQGHFPLTYNIPITIICAATDQESADALGSLLTLFFGPLRNIGGGQRITGRDDKGDTWEVRLPLSFVPSPTTNSAIADDPKDSIWAMTIDMVVQFEDKIILEQNVFAAVATATDPTAVIQLTGTAGPISTTLLPTIEFPDEIKLNEAYQIRVKSMKDSQRIVLSDGKIASFDPETLMLSARRLGTFEIQVLDRRPSRLPGDLPDDGGWAPKVMATKRVNVVL